MSSLLTNAQGQPANLQGIFAGQTCFFCCGGPSIAKQAATVNQLKQQGYLIVAVNNVAASIVWPHVWFCYDTPAHFHESIWRDSRVMKFAPAHRLTDQIKTREHQTWIDSEQQASDCPNVWGYAVERENPHFDPETFLTCEPLQCGGKENKRRVRNVMLIALRLLHHLGCVRVVLVGCDWQMSQEKPYGFGEKKRKWEVEFNNESYGLVSAWFSRLPPTFSHSGFEVLNGTPESQLDVFPFVELDQFTEKKTG